MTDTQARSSVQSTFEDVVLIDDVLRCEKLLRGGALLRGFTKGRLDVDRGTLRWEAPDRVAILPGVSSATRFNDLFIRIDYQGASGPAVAFLQDRSGGTRRAIPTTKELLPRLRTALGYPPPTAEERELSATLEIAGADAAMRKARTGMVIAGLVTGIGALVTIVSYSNAEPGEGYTLYWGAIVFGALWFLVHAGELRTAAKAKERALGQAARPPVAHVDAAPPAPVLRPATHAVAMPPPVPPPPVPPPPPPALPTIPVAPAPQPVPATAPPDASRGDPMNDTTLGIRFDISRLGPDGHGLAAWRVIWSAIDPAALGEARLLEGETAGTLAGREAIFCVAVEADSHALEGLRAALDASPDFAGVAATPPFLDAATAAEEPLVPVGSVGAHGELEGRWPAAGLNAARERMPARAAARPLVTAGAAGAVVDAPLPPPTVAATPPPPPAVEELPPPPSLAGLPPPPTMEAPPEPSLLEGQPPPPSTEAPPSRLGGIPRRTWLVIGAVAVLLAGVLGFVVLGGGGDAGGPLATADEVEAQLVAILEDTDLSFFGDPTVEGVTCPQELPTVTGETFECTVQLSSDPEASIDVAFADEDGTVVWCNLMSQGALSLNTEGLSDCGYFDGEEGAADETTTTERTITTTAPAPTAPPAAGTVGTAAGNLAIDDLWFTNEYPAGCEASADVAQQCLTSPANRIAVLVLRVGVGQNTSAVMEDITDEAFQSEVEDESGLRTTATQLSTSSDSDTIDVVYAFLGVENPSSVILHWPGNPSVTVDG